MFRAGLKEGPEGVGACGMVAEKGANDATAAEPPSPPGGCTAIEPELSCRLMPHSHPITGADGEGYGATDSGTQRNGRLARLLGMDDDMDGATTCPLRPCQ